MAIDQELIARTFAEGPGEIDAIAIYEIEAGKIAEAWFKISCATIALTAAGNIIACNGASCINGIGTATLTFHSSG